MNIFEAIEMWSNRRIVKIPHIIKSYDPDLKTREIASDDVHHILKSVIKCEPNFEERMSS